MRISLTVSLDVDPAAWELTYGVPPEELRDDVRQYVRTQIDSSAAGEECGLSVRDIR